MELRLQGLWERGIEGFYLTADFDNSSFEKDSDTAGRILRLFSKKKKKKPGESMWLSCRGSRDEIYGFICRCKFLGREDVAFFH